MSDASYHQPDLSYHQPDLSYHLPEPSYHRPEPSYHRPDLSHRLQVPSHRLQVGSHRLQVPSHRLQVVSHHLREASHRLQVGSHHSPPNFFSCPNQPLPPPAAFQGKASRVAPPLPLSFTSDEQLLAACLRHDRQAQHQLYQRHKAALFSCALRILGDRELAQDALQEAFVAAFQRLAQFRQEAPLAAWLKGIVVRCALRVLRQEQRMEVYRPQHHPEPLVPWHDALTGEALERAIAELPAGYRAVFCLVEVEGYLHREVAELLSISEGTSKSQLHHAKRLLQVKLHHLQP
ncbi:sigma-70 family RNA polymerase sigma factor [Hymenobacter sp. ASUV-10]|uniref:Sigma-70 family RNA polymerase sigma factor n=1 Tax=Hymenobacter aranciens TaxID=3063996 RepID=A0ABT9BD51_9BACT|nr:sigma-70 family RNA polymerase sigma factor [Hymenobacter sp. ASUV-10]MDO7876186.1 sigma-70 family RNA polymerase sigma factor [Hymenobacter sp. ASUV-10]